MYFNVYGCGCVAGFCYWSQGESVGGREGRCVFNTSRSLNRKDIDDVRCNKATNPHQSTACVILSWTFLILAPDCVGLTCGGLAAVHFLWVLFASNALCRVDYVVFFPLSLFGLS